MGVGPAALTLAQIKKPHAEAFSFMREGPGLYTLFYYRTDQRYIASVILQLDFPLSEFL